MLLRFVRDENFNRLVGPALKATRRTYASDKSASRDAIANLLDPDQLQKFAAESFQVLSDEMPDLVRNNPILASEIYEAAFAYSAPLDEERLNFGGSISPMNFLKKDLVPSARSGMIACFSVFLELAPSHAVPTLIRIVRAKARLHHRLFDDAGPTAFTFWGRSARFRNDRSTFWLAYCHEEAELLSTLENVLIAVGKNAPNPTFGGLVTAVAENNDLACVWSCLLRMGQSAPSTAGVLVKELSWAIPILAGETHVAAGDFLRAIYPMLSSEERTRVEEAILIIPITVDGDE
jgi:hypothetical protein